MNNISQEMLCTKTWQGKQSNEQKRTIISRNFYKESHMCQKLLKVNKTDKNLYSFTFEGGRL